MLRCRPRLRTAPPKRALPNLTPLEWEFWRSPAAHAKYCCVRQLLGSRCSRPFKRTALNDFGGLETVHHELLLYSFRTPRVPFSGNSSSPFASTYDDERSWYKASARPDGGSA